MLYSGVFLLYNLMERAHMKRKWLTALIIYIGLIIACLVVIYAVPSIRGLLEKTYITEFTTIDITDDIFGYIVRDETVHTAKEDSSVSRLIESVELAKANARVVELTQEETEDEADTASAAGSDQKSGDNAADKTEEKNEERKSDKYDQIIEELGDNVEPTLGGYSRVAGFVVYSVDGKEAAFDRDHLYELKEEDFEELKNLKSIDTPKSKCQAGDPVFKIVDNSKWYLVFYIDNDAGEKYYEGRSVSIETGGELVPVKVLSAETGKKTTRVILTCKMFSEELLKTRTMKTKVTVASAEGLLVQDKSIIENDGQKGVLIKNKLGEHKFRPIKVKADDGTRCVVYSDIYVDDEGNYVETLSTYDEVVAEPSEEEIAEINAK